MSQMLISCPNCEFGASARSFEVLSGNRLKCRRCRGDFIDPDAFKREITYTDCDFDRVVNRYPFALGGSVELRVRDGYMACLSASGRDTALYSAGRHHISEVARGTQLIYICLNPRMLWGSSGRGAFGVHGSAQLSITEEYIRRGINEDQNFVHSLENRLSDLLNEYLNAYIDMEISKVGSGALLSVNGYISAHGIIKEGIRLISVSPKGFRQGAVHNDIIGAGDDEARVLEIRETESEIRLSVPVTIEKLPTREYTIANGTEEVFELPLSRRERHKAGEIINPEAFKSVKSIIRFRKKEFEFPYGWGIYNQSCDLRGEYCANGTISFYVDNTEKFSELILSAGSFEKFAEFFFLNVLKKELSEHLKPLLNHYLSKQDFDINNISSVLSALSLKLNESLNGDNDDKSAGAFKRYGLRTSKLDILRIGFKY